MRRELLCIFIGAVLEFVVFLSLLPQDSTQPITSWQTVMGYTQIPGAAVFGLFGGTFGHFLDRLPSPLAGSGVILIFALAFLTQVAVFALPIWVLTRIIRLRKN